jgi:hypothetical protein
MGVKLGLLHCGRNVGCGFFESRVLRRILGSRRDEVTGGVEKTNKELYCLYSSSDIIR